MTSQKEQFYKQQIADLQVENATLKKQVVELLKVNAELAEQAAKLTDNIASLSKNSSFTLFYTIRDRVSAYSGLKGQDNIAQPNGLGKETSPLPSP